MTDKPAGEAGGTSGKKSSSRGLRPGDFVIHTTCHAWGIGKIIAGREGRNVTVLFEDGREKIISRDYHSVLRPVPRPVVFDPPATAAHPPASPKAKKAAQPYPTDGKH